MRYIAWPIANSGSSCCRSRATELKGGAITNEQAVLGSEPGAHRDERHRQT